ncbi:unnamed protein product [Microthlaspi erraticum]|uniref:3'-5' exonuclease domain-containing protein n=1 Tax=Microthlaspi erraticum TaxID=1685480 RepID=A0A6D2ICK2_9BRAS|nr:unnamed protein product [Microthlaspi erraticum]
MFLEVDLGIARIKTTIAKYQKQVDEAIQALMSSSMNRNRLIGLDTIQWQTPSGKSKIALLQLSDGSQCLIVRIVYFYRLPQSLFNFLSFPGFTFVGFGIKDAMASLREEHGLVCKNVLEAGHSGSRSSMLYLVKNELRTMPIPPIHYMPATWCPEDDLTDDLVKLAVSNAHTAFRIRDKLIFYP